MNDRRWQQINALFDAALERPAVERAEFLNAACAGQDDLRVEVTRLLDAHERAGAFIEQPRAQAALDLLGPDTEAPATGRQIGPWRILREIGRGGMGTVYLAERADQHFDRQIAIKLIRRGMDTESVLRRFRTERQILANLDHPNIARLHDGGTTDDGLPYFVMEHIEGEPIDGYCDARRLTITERLELFRQVCAATAFAHQNLVVHRDIKPSNILVTPGGTAKLLDFGIARLLHDGADAEAPQTVTGLQLMTPEYASPEQLQGLRATTLSDVYALGVMLYELLSGRPPHRFPGRSFPEILRIVTTVDPEKPSVVVATDAEVPADGISAATIAGHREGSIERLRRRLQGDLDIIVLRALHRDPARRYPSVEQFHEDIRRHLVGLPVLARPDTLAYRGRKFVQRNRVAVVAAVLLLGSLLGGVTTTMWQAHEARAQALLARAAQERAERRFDDVRRLARAVIFDYHDAIKDLAGSTPVRQRMVQDGLEYLDRLAREGGSDPSLQRELALAYERVGDVQGGTLYANLGNTAGALESYRKAEAIYRALLAADSTDAQARHGFAFNSSKLSQLLWETGDIEQAVARIRPAAVILDELVARSPEDMPLRYQLARLFDTLGMMLLEKGDPVGSEAQHRRELGHYEFMARSDPDGEAVRRGLSTAHEHIGAALLTRGDLPGALQENEIALELRRSVSAEHPLNADLRRSLSVSYYNQGEILRQFGRRREALDCYRRDLDIVAALATADPQNEQYRGDRAYALIRVGDMHSELVDLSGALTDYRASLTIRAADVAADSSNLWKRASLIEAHAKIGGVLGRRHDGAAMVAQCARTVALIERTPLEPTNAQFRSFFAHTYADLGAAHLAASRGRVTPAFRRERWRAALEMYRRSAAIWQDLKARELLGAGEAEVPAAVNREVERCVALLDG